MHKPRVHFFFLVMWHVLIRQSMRATLQVWHWDFLPFDMILLTILLVGKFLKLFCKLTFQVSKTRVP